MVPVAMDRIALACSAACRASSPCSICSEKPSPPSATGLRHARPGGRFLGDHHRAGAALARRRVLRCRRKATASRFSAPAMDIGDPFAGLAAVVAIEHRGHGIDAQPVDVKVLEPVQRARDEEALAPRCGRNCRCRCSSPGGSLRADPDVRRAPCRRSGRAHADRSGKCAGTQSRITPIPAPWQASTKRAKSAARAVAGGRREQAERLIAPGAAEGMLGDRHQLDMGEAQLDHIGNEARRSPRPRTRRCVVAGHAEPGAECTS